MEFQATYSMTGHRDNPGSRSRRLSRRFALCCLQHCDLSACLTNRPPQTCAVIMRGPIRAGQPLCLGLAGGQSV